MPQADISVVICTYNRADILRLALDSLIAQQTQGAFSYEIVVVDDASTDKTHETVEEAAARSDVPIRYARAEGKGVARARNRGIEEALGEWIAFTDDDQANEPNWLHELVLVAREQDVDCVGGTVQLRLDTVPAIPLTPLTKSILGNKTHAESRVTRLMECPGTGSVMMKRPVFDTIGKFNESLVWGGEDADLMLRVMNAGIAVWFAPKAVVHHLIPPYRTSPAYFRWASLRVGVALAEVDCRRRGLGKLMLLCVARIGQAVLVHVPRLLIALARRNAADALERKCLLWRAMSYTRETLQLLSPRLFTQKRFFNGLEFRAERTTLGASADG